MEWPCGERAVPKDDPEAVRLGGRLLDGEGAPVADGLIEVWCPEPAGFARCLTDDHGAWAAIVPRPRSAGGQAPHLALAVFGRGLLRHLVTRAYLPGDQAPNDNVLERVPADRRATLLAERTNDGYRFDIRLQGPRETVFFDV